MSPFLINIFSNHRSLRIFVYACCVMLASITMQAQTVGQFIKEGDKALNSADYYTALYYFNQAHSLDSVSADVNWRMAEASRNTNDYRSALNYYLLTLEEDRYSNYPLAEFYAGMMQRMLGEYNSAKIHLRSFLNNYHSSDKYSKEATQALASSAWAVDNQGDSVAVIIKRMENGINSGFTEFAGGKLSENTFQYSSMREEKTDENKNKTYVSKIYTVQLENGKWKEHPELFPWLSELKDHTANGSFNAMKNRFYFTQCENKNVSELRCDIYLSENRDGVWQKPKKLGASINPGDYTNTHPREAILPDGSIALFFSSDRPGGMGKMDIWSAKRNENGEFETPANLGYPINTSGNEITPYYDDSASTLYFSSDWHYGLGGYDIFLSEKKISRWTDPLNVGRPLNSTANDTYFNLDENRSSGTLSSNRPGSLFLKGEGCCNDLYSFEFPAKKISSNRVLAETKVSFKDSAAISITSTKTEITESKKADKTAPIDTFSTIQQLQSLIPVTIYFHNDIPNPRSNDDSTMLNYKSTYEDYSVMRRGYKEAYTAVTHDESKSSQAIDHLFTDYVDAGYYHLLRFSKLMLDELRAGKRVSLTIEGYCSPLALNDYNIHLANRRIASLKNYLYKYYDGALQPYILNGSLILNRAPFGEEKADKSVSDNRLDTGRSVYDPRAALERRVAIIAIDIK